MNNTIIVHYLLLSTTSKAAHNAGLAEEPTTPEETDERESCSGPQQSLEEMSGSCIGRRLEDRGQISPNSNTLREW